MHQNKQKSKWKFIKINNRRADVSLGKSTVLLWGTLWTYYHLYWIRIIGFLSFNEKARKHINSFQQLRTVVNKIVPLMKRFYDAVVYSGK